MNKPTPIVIAEQATVYRGPTRRFFTKAGAYRDYARDAIRQVCGCNWGDVSDCKFHCSDLGHQVEVVERLARLYGYRARKLKVTK